MSDDNSAVRDWWADNPMTYGRTHGRTGYTDGEIEFGSKAFFEHADVTFYGWNTPLHDHRPFGRLFPYDTYKGKSVFEIGCGMGSMAMNWARQGARMTAVDLTPTAIAQTKRRFELFGLEGDIRQADARHLPFADSSFDYGYSWGVLHHSPDLAKSVGEMMRVLKPGGGFGVMLYSRDSFLYHYTIRFVEGFLHDERQFLDPLALASRYSDGAREEGNPHTWPITKNEARQLFGHYADDVRVDVFGTDLAGIFPFVIPGIGAVLPAWFKKPWARRFGWSLWIHGHKRSA